ncbi:uracil-DNA glycosylase [Catenulispora acidiphila DSM 44928]|uniref:Uracil-DNA glycosylase n=1 Tax=Catenulispora acidiphila (strain DSM 44928 / JCM 14897 / NBRC 102108 / NRRL B-24433 / ID139908) TaxID=479433 RepID=C7Q7Y9_CATAD|nr:uracil-DNA glycosylase [Catenulispora acidiphila]ACU74156.1 uracil-DNA glycosylase [Catenulispora acidiphila DSM 44928]
MRELIPASWAPVLAAETEQPYFADLEAFLKTERAEHQVFPPEDEVFAALEATPYEDVKVVLIGQDPYHDDGQAHGMCFSVRPGVRIPPSLRNMYKELDTDLGVAPVKHGYLKAWADQGVLLLNTVLTVRAHEPASHKDRGWEKFTDAVIKDVSAREKPVVFVLWGAHAKKKAKLIDASRHAIVQGAHPSPLSAKLFFGSKPFSAVNEALAGFGQEPIDWKLPETV